MEMKLTYITIHTMEPEIMKDFYVKYQEGRNGGIKMQNVRR